MSAADLHGVGALVRLAARALALALPGLAACGGFSGRELVPFVPEDSRNEESVSDANDLGPADVEAASEHRRGAVDSGLDASKGRDATHRDATSIIRSGTRFCETSRECFGLTCEFGPTPNRGTCVAGCMIDDDCDINERCLGGQGFGASCLTECVSPTQCALGFECFDFRGDGSSYTCLPGSWVLLLGDGAD